MTILPRSLVHVIRIRQGVRRFPLLATPFTALPSSALRFLLLAAIALALPCAARENPDGGKGERVWVPDNADGAYTNPVIHEYLAHAFANRSVEETSLRIDPATAIRPYDYIVALDGSGDFATIQDAVDACRDYAERDYRILIRRGTYREKLVIPAWKRRITFVGEQVEQTVITYDDYSGKPDPLGKKHSTFTSHTVLVAGTDIVFENITFENNAGQVGQAVALHVEGDRCVFRNCRLMGNQDTLFGGGESSRQFFDSCYIEGTTDFIFGPSTAVFRKCTIMSKKDSYITAASTVPTREHGFVFLDCRLTADSVGRKVYLGRPWRLYAYTAFVRCEMGPHILPAGWHNWSKPEAEKTARYMEYKSTGPGANPSARVAWSRQMTNEEASQLTVQHILSGFDNWNPER